MNRYLLNTLAVIAIAVSAHAQSFSVTPGPISQGDTVYYTVNDPSNAGQFVSIKIFGAGGSVVWDTVLLNEFGYGVGSWVADFTGWTSSLCGFRYQDADGGYHYETRPIL